MIWGLKIPAKVKIFLWRACNNWIPTMCNLVMRKLNVDGTCHVCKFCHETTMHSLWGCSGLKHVRSNCPFLNGIRFDDKVHAWSSNFLSQFEATNSVIARGNSGNVLPMASWRPPDEGSFKVNSDASLNLARHKVGIGLVIRDHCGFVMASSAQHISANITPIIAEALAVLRGIIFALQSGLVPFVVETDALCVVKLVDARKPDLSDVGLVIGNIIQRISDYPGCKVVHAPRKANMVAYTISKMSLDSDDDFFWMDNYPPSPD